MIWAGASANTTDAFCSAPFRVYNDGHVDMGDVSIVQGVSGSMGLTVSNGSLTLGTVDDGSIPSPLTQIVPQTYNTIDASLSSRVASVGDNTTGDTYNMTPTLTQTTNSCSFSGTKTTTLKTIPSNVPNGTMTLTISNASMSVSASLTGTQDGLLSVDSMDAGVSLYNFPKVGTASVSMVFYVTVNGVRKTKLVESISASDSVGEELNSSSSSRRVNLSVSGSKTAAIASSVAVKFTPGDVIGLLTETVITYSTSTIPKGRNVTYTKSTAASITLSWTATSENYNNMYYANGLLLSSSDKKYIAANSSSTATAILQARSGSAIFKFNANGLLQSLNGSTFFRVNPLVAIIKLSFNTAAKTGYQASYLYRVAGSTAPSTNREAAGNVILYHNLKTNTGVTNYAAQGTYYCTGTTEYARTLMFDNVEVNSMRVHFMTGNNHYDPQNTGNVDYAMIFFYDYGTYS